MTPNLPRGNTREFRSCTKAGWVRYKCVRYRQQATEGNRIFL